MAAVGCLRALGSKARKSGNLWGIRGGRDAAKRRVSIDAKRALEAFPAGSNGEFNLPEGTSIGLLDLNYRRSIIWYEK